MSRNSRLTADVSLEAHNLLRGYAKKHERSKGFLLEKMIRKFCGIEEAAPATEVVVVEKPKAKAKRKVFKPPTVEEVREYCDPRCNNVDANKFVAHYETAGWKRGNTSIKNWKACVHTWEGKDKPAVKSDESLQGNW